MTKTCLESDEHDAMSTTKSSDATTGNESEIKDKVSKIGIFLKQKNVQSEESEDCSSDSQCICSKIIIKSYSAESETNVESLSQKESPVANFSDHNSNSVEEDEVTQIDSVGLSPEHSATQSDDCEKFSKSSDNKSHHSHKSSHSNSQHDLSSKSQKSFEYLQDGDLLSQSSAFNSSYSRSSSKNSSRNHANSSDKKSIQKSKSSSFSLSEKSYSSRKSSKRKSLCQSATESSLLDKTRDYYLKKWQEEDKKAAKEQREVDQTKVLQPKKSNYKIRNIKREHIEKYEGYKEDELEDYEKPPIVLPENPSKKFLDEYKKPSMLRLLSPKKQFTVEEKKKVITKRKFDDFMDRNHELEILKAQLADPKPSPTKKVNNEQTFNRLFHMGITRCDGDYDDFYLEKVASSPKQKSVKVDDAFCERLNHIKRPEAKEEKFETTHFINKNSIDITKGKPSFLNRTSFDYADVISKREKEAEENQQRLEFMQTIEMAM